MSDAHSKALRTARVLLDTGHALDEVLNCTLIPVELRDFVRETIQREENIELTPVTAIVRVDGGQDWLLSRDRAGWYFWPTLRQHLLTRKGWAQAAVRSLDDASDRVLARLAPPEAPSFDIRGLVIGFVQSGKTANYTAVIAKAVDAGYRLVIVLAGTDNGLRLQTNTRLKKELIGSPVPNDGAVRLPPLGKRWHEFTRDELDGDFRPGWANHAALQGSQPVILVVKKNGPVLRRLLDWLASAPDDLRRTVPFLVIDDEADVASVDTRGSYQSEEDPLDEDYEPPSVINGLIRRLLGKFNRCAYIAYTATPFANVLIPHDANDPTAGDDLYPRDFIIDLPKPQGYFGAEEIFGRLDSGERHGGLDVIRDVTEPDLDALEAGRFPDSLEHALIDFMLAGAARAQRGRADQPATMLVHASQRIQRQSQLSALILQRFTELRDEWRYQRAHGIRERLAQRWEQDFRRTTRASHLQRDVPFAAVEPFVGPFIEAVRVCEINSATGEVLDYEQEPGLKAIAIGGNRLSRGLTLEGLLVSYFIRRSATYDTLMQMGRWFGYRGGYEDLTRIFTTRELRGWFSDIAVVEHQLREDIRVYEDQGLTPRQVGMKIWQHPDMEVTAALKRRFASITTLARSYALTLQQTFKFPLSRPEDLAVQAEANLQAVRGLARALEPFGNSMVSDSGPAWNEVPAEIVLRFLSSYRTDEQARSISMELMVKYIEDAVAAGELVRWTIAVRGLNSPVGSLGTVDWGMPSGPVHQISRTRLRATDSVGAVVSPGDERIGLTLEARAQVAQFAEAAISKRRAVSENVIARGLRGADHGLLLLYPISRHSGRDLAPGGSREPLYADSSAAVARDLVALAISLPGTARVKQPEAYLEGSVGWRPEG
jgi:hypothetical protein